MVLRLLVRSVWPILFGALVFAQTASATNSIHVIAPYKHHGLWVFDDPRVGLAREPFVSGADLMIDKAVAGFPNPEQGFLLLFSAAPFPGHQLKLKWNRAEAGGNWYYSPMLRMESWLCPALFKYFDAAPKEIYVQLKPKSADADTHDDLSLSPNRRSAAVRAGSAVSVLGAPPNSVSSLDLAASTFAWRAVSNASGRGLNQSQ